MQEIFQALVFVKPAKTLLAKTRNVAEPESERERSTGQKLQGKVCGQSGGH